MDQKTINVWAKMMSDPQRRGPGAIRYRDHCGFHLGMGYRNSEVIDVVEGERHPGT